MSLCSRSTICSSLIFLISKYSGCLFRKYFSYSSTVDVSFNRLSFILW